MFLYTSDKKIIEQLKHTAEAKFIKQEQDGTYVFAVSDSFKELEYGDSFYISNKLNF